MQPLVLYSNFFKIISTVAFLVSQTRGMFVFNTVILVVNSLGGGYTHTCIQTFTDRSNYKKPGVRLV